MKIPSRWLQGSPIFTPRWVLTLEYSLFVLLALAGIVAGIPTFDLMTWPGYTLVWSIAIAAASLFAAYGSVSERRERFERWGAASLAALLSAYVGGALLLVASGGEHAASRAGFAVVLLIAAVTPTVRAFYLLRRTGAKRAN